MKCYYRLYKSHRHIYAESKEGVMILFMLSTLFINIKQEKSLGYIGKLEQSSSYIFVYQN